MLETYWEQKNQFNGWRAETKGEENTKQYNVVVRICYQHHLCSETKINRFLPTANVTNNSITRFSTIKRAPYVAVNVFSSPPSTPSTPKEQYNLLTFRSHKIKISAKIQTKFSKGFRSSMRNRGPPSTRATTDFFVSFLIIIIWRHEKPE